MANKKLSDEVYKNHPGNYRVYNPDYDVISEQIRKKKHRLGRTVGTKKPMEILAVVVVVVVVALYLTTIVLLSLAVWTSLSYIPSRMSPRSHTCPRPFDGANHRETSSSPWTTSRWKVDSYPLFWIQRTSLLSTSISDGLSACKIAFDRSMLVYGLRMLGFPRYYKFQIFCYKSLQFKMEKSFFEFN